MRIELNGVLHNVEERGAGRQRQLVFLHYFGGSSRAWREVIDGLEERGCLATELRCFAPDLRGFGSTGAPATGYTIDHYTDDLHALVCTLELDAFYLVGHSMGGKIALNYAARRPVGLEALLLLAPSPPTPETMAPDERARLLATHGDRAAAAATIRRITHLPIATAIVERAIEDNVHSSQAAWRAWLEQGSRENIAAAMARIDTPTTIVAGASDPVISPQLLQQELVARLDVRSMQLIPNAGHLLPLEAPHAIVDVLKEML